MKKTLFSLLVCMACASISYAQIKVNNDTQKIGIGTSTPDAAYKTTIDGSLLMKFGNTNGFAVTENYSGRLTYIDISPIRIYNNPYLEHTLGGNNPFYNINTDNIYATIGTVDYLTTYNFYNYSDERLKRNINTLSFDRKSFSQLKPVSYEITDAASMQKVKDRQETATYIPQYGFLAQELQKVYPQLVLKDEETGYLKMKPLEMIPILVAALQDQQKQNDDQQKQIDNQQKQIEELKQLVGVKSILRSSEEVDDVTGISSIAGTVGKATLYQNVPNPFNQSTEIRYYIPESSQNAQLCIYNLQGNQIKQIAITERGEGSYQLSGSSLTAGMYLYALIVDAREIDTKRMILTE